MKTHPTPENKQLIHWLALGRTPGIGPKHFAKLLEFFPDLSELFQQSRRALEQIKLPTLSIDHLLKPNWKKIEEDWQWSQQANQAIITWNDADYPKLLKEIPSSPPILFIKGKLESINQPQIAIVGSRNPTLSGIENAGYFAEQLVKLGFTITSGLALGIDAASHKSALKAQGNTIAVMATGMNHIYPSQNRALAQEIIGNGALISEFPLGVSPLRENFPRRNRIISGLSLGILVVEAAERSGSLITAGYAAEQGREVFALPGGIHNPFSAGCHKLIQQGAKLVTNTKEIIEELKLHLNYTTNEHKAVPKVQQTLDKPYQNLVNCIGYETTPIEILTLRCGISLNIMTAMLSELEITGYIKTVPGGIVRIV